MTDGKALVVGAPYYLQASGAIYIFELMNKVWVQTAGPLMAKPNQVAAELGHNVAITKGGELKLVFILSA